MAYVFRRTKVHYYLQEQQVMRKEKYVYNPRTLQYEKLKRNPKEQLVRMFGFVSSSLLLAAVMMYVSYQYFPSPKEQSLNRELSQLQFYFGDINEKISTLSEDLELLHEKDKEVHRIIFGMSPMDNSVWEGGIGGSDRYPYLDNFESGRDIEKSLEQADKLERKVELQKLSLDTILNLAIAREKRLSSIPSIKPVQEDKLKRKIGYLSGYGYRIHPIHKVKKFHKGIDFTAPSGTAIQATGDGKVTRVEKRNSGYGVNVTIDHGYGYKTLYAHMKSVDVKKGEKVSRGQKIGTVGSTGASTAPHCHYEVHYNGKAINPIDFCLDGLSPEEYQELVHKCSIENQSFD